MSIFADILKKITEWVGVPGLIAAFVLALSIWLYYDLVVDMTLNNTMTFGLGICSLLLIMLIKVVFGFFKKVPDIEEGSNDEK